MVKIKQQHHTAENTADIDKVIEIISNKKD